MYFIARKESPSVITDIASYAIIARACEAIENIGGKSSFYYRQMQEIMSMDCHISYRAEALVGITTALKNDVLDGRITSITEIMHGEIFGDYLDMAEYLQKEGYKDAAAVITGSTLEAHIRQLCLKHGISAQFTGRDGSEQAKKASQMNQDLGKQVYSLFDQKQVTAWLDLRNSAAHGKYGEYTEQQVSLFIDWLRDFISRNPA
jgi:hypothetical protein